MVLEPLVGPTLIKNDGTEVPTAELSTAPGGVVGIYFSAHWCPPCRGFTPELVTVYNELKEANKDFEIVFVSWDGDDDSFQNYHKEMPWLAIPFDKSEIKDPLGKKYNVEGIPSLVLLAADTGDIITKEGRNPVSEYGAAAFPFTTERLTVVKAEAIAKKEEKAKGLADLKFLGTLTTIDEPEKELNTDTVARRSEALAFAFMSGRDQGSAIVLPILLDIRQKLGEEKLAVIVVPMQMEGSEFSDTIKEKLVGVPMVQEGDVANGVVEKFKCVVGEIDTPCVLMIDARDESVMKILVEDAARNIYYHGEVAFPWTESAISEVEQRKEKLKEENRGKMKNLGLFAESDSCHVVDKSGSVVDLATLQSRDVVGLYFSAHWCGPCRHFTPKLVEIYNKCKETGKAFEVVFLSSDKNKEEFDSYYSEMPWYTLSYDDRSLKEDLSDMYDVGGIPTLILLNGSGEVVTEDGRSAVDMGSEYFPWDEESMKRGRDEEETREKKKAEEAQEALEKAYADQETAGKVVIRAHRGISNIQISAADQTVTISSFSTVAAPEAVVPANSKAYYEVTFSNGEGVSQIGWATSQFGVCEKYTGDGVGDDAFSYGFDGQRKCKWFDGSTPWGTEFSPEDGNVLGVAADMKEGKLYFGLNGDWGEPLGVAFDNLDTGLNLYPALTACEMTFSVNFGDSEMKHGPPDDTFSTLHQVLSQ